MIQYTLETELSNISRILTDLGNFKSKYSF